MRSFLPLCFLLAVSSGLASAQSPARHSPQPPGHPPSPPALQARASPNGQHIVRIKPGRRSAELGLFSNATPQALAEWHRFDGKTYKKLRSVPLQNPVAPDDFEVTDKGQLITLDNWRSLGQGDVVVMYGPTGKLLWKFRLADLYPAEDLARLQPSGGQTRWRCPDGTTYIDATNALQIEDVLGGRFTFRLDAGKVNYEPGVAPCDSAGATPAPAPVTSAR